MPHEQLAEPDAAPALAAVGHLVAADARAVEFLASRFRPAELATHMVQRLIADLDSDTFAVREAASRDLANYGSAATAELRAALAKAESPEACDRLRRLLDLAASPRIVQDRKSVV